MLHRHRTDLTETQETPRNTKQATTTQHKKERKRHARTSILDTLHRRVDERRGCAVRIEVDAVDAVRVRAVGVHERAA